MSIIEMSWKPRSYHGFSFTDARRLAHRIGGLKSLEAEIKTGEDGLLHMQIPTVNMVTRWMAVDPAGFLREALSGVDPDSLVRGPEFEVRIW